MITICDYVLLSMSNNINKFVSGCKQVTRFYTCFTMLSVQKYSFHILWTEACRRGVITPLNRTWNFKLVINNDYWHLNKSSLLISLRWKTILSLVPERTWLDSFELLNFNIYPETVYFIPLYHNSFSFLHLIY